jgi:hypothetical protein
MKTLVTTIILVFLVTFAKAQDDSNVRPPVTAADIQIVQKARQILNSPTKWNRADTRVCPDDAATFSLYCALEKATKEVSSNFEHRGAAMQEARFVIDEISHQKNYDHRLMGYNNDPTTTFADIQKVFDLLETRIAKRLKEPDANHSLPSKPTATQVDLQIIKRAQDILNSPSKWNRSATQDCPSNATTFNLFCALHTAELEIVGKSEDNSMAMKEARTWITRSAPNGSRYKARLIDYNNDPTTRFEDVQRLLQLVENDISKQLAP